jgi:nicotinate-nucleotide adenylyltransferase
MTDRIGILGGTFDPIHYGHLAIAEEVRVALALDRVLFVPAAYQPLKAHRPGADAHHRLAMARLACATNTFFSVSDVEIARPGPSYTVTTLQAFHDAEPGELFFILGADALNDLPRWREAARIPELTSIVAVQRPGITLNMKPRFAALPALRERLTMIDGPRLDISSCELRQRAADKRPLRYLMPDSVVEYIAEHGLYQSHS